MKDEQGSIQGLVCVAQDITERKRIEEERRQMNDRLVETSRRLGMADVATSVLHNVGNVLNSIQCFCRDHELNLTAVARRRCSKDFKNVECPSR